MTENIPGRVTDPKTLRALSHPTRWAIIELIGIDVTATATRCAEITGESVASCSYHLGMLAKYGFVEPAGGGQGRERPWRLAQISTSWSHDFMDDTDDEGQLAVETLNEVNLDHQLQQMKNYIHRASQERPEWRTNAGSWATTAHLTSDELAELAAELSAIADRYRPRIGDPSLRPAGSRPVRVFLTTWLPRPPEEGS